MRKKPSPTDSRSANPLLLSSRWHISPRALHVPIVCIVLGAAVLYFGDRSVAALFTNNASPSGFSALEAFVESHLSPVTNPTGSAEAPKSTVARPLPANSARRTATAAADRTSVSGVLQPKVAGAMPAVANSVTVNQRATNQSFALAPSASIGTGPIVSTTANATWTGGSGSSDNWSDAANWTSGQNPDGAGQSIVHFAGSSRLTPNNDYGAYTQFNQILFDSGASSFTLNGNAIKLAANGGSVAKIENNSPNLQTVNFNSSGQSIGFVGAGELDPTLGDLTINNQIFVDGSGTQVIGVYGNNGHTLTLNGALTNGSATAAFENFTNSNVIFNAANTYTGMTAIDAGTLTYNAAPGNATSQIFVGNGSTAAIPGTATLYANTNAFLLVGSGVTLSNTIVTNKADTGSGFGTGIRFIGTGSASGTATYSGNIYLNGGATIISPSGARVILSGNIQDGTDTGNVSHVLTIGSTGGFLATNLTLSGNNSYSGGTIFANGGSGTININSATALGTGLLTFKNTTRLDNTSGAPITLTNNNPVLLNGGTLVFVGSADGSHDLNFGTGAVTLSGSRIIDVLTPGSTLTFGGPIGDGASSGSLTLNSGVNGGTLALTNTASTYSGDTAISGGVLQVSSLADAGTQSSLGTGSKIIFSGSSSLNELKYVGAGSTSNRTIEVIAGSFNPPGTATIDSSGTGALVLTGTFQADATSYTKSLILQGSNTANNTFGGAITNPVSGGGVVNFQKNGTGTWVVSGANTYTGATTVNGGTLAIDSAGSTTSRLANTTSITVNSGGTLLLANSTATPSTDRINDAAGVTLNGGSAFKTAGLSEGTRPSGPSAMDGAFGMGALTLQNTTSTAHATIDFATGANGSSLVFNTLSSSSAGAFLDILNWTGNQRSDNGATGNDRLLFANSPGLTDAQLANYAFYGDNGALVGSGGTIIPYGNEFEIVPIPEASTWAVAALAFATTSYQFIARRRRRRAVSLSC